MFSNSGFANTVGNYLLLNGNFNNGIVNTVSNVLVSNGGFNSGLVNTIGNNLVANTQFIRSLASTLSDTSNSYYKSLIGPVGTVADSKSIYNSLAPFTLNCSTGNNGMNCSTTYNTTGPISYNLGPTTGTFSTTYNFGNNGVLAVGNWKLFQDKDGNLQIINSGTAGALVSNDFNSKGVISANILNATGSINAANNKFHVRGSDGYVATQQGIFVGVDGNASGFLNPKGYLATDGAMVSNYVKSRGNVDIDGSINSVGYIVARNAIRTPDYIAADRFVKF